MDPFNILCLCFSSPTDIFLVAYVFQTSADDNRVSDLCCWWSCYSSVWRNCQYNVRRCIMIMIIIPQWWTIISVECCSVFEYIVRRAMQMFWCCSDVEMFAFSDRIERNAAFILNSSWRTMLVCTIMLDDLSKMSIKTVDTVDDVFVLWRLKL